MVFSLFCLELVDWGGRGGKVYGIRSGVEFDHIGGTYGIMSLLVAPEEAWAV